MSTLDDLTFSTQLTAAVVTTDGAISKGDLLLFDSSILKWRKSTSANRTATGVKTSAVAVSNAGEGPYYIVQYKDGGLVSNSVSGLGAGTESYVIADASGRMSRSASPTGSDDVIGKCDINGRVELLFGGLINTSSGGGTPAGGTGAVQYNNAGALGGVAPPAGAAKPLVSNGAGVAPIFDSISLANNAAVVAPGAASEVLVNDGTGAVSSAPDVKAGSGYISIGTNPAASGGFRAANNVAWMARNAANSADRQLCALNASDVVVLGNTSCAMTLDASGAGVSIPSGVLKLGATLPATGSMRVADGFTLKSVTGGTDRPLLDYNGGTFIIGDFSVVPQILIRSTAAGDIRIQVNSSNHLMAVPNGIQLFSGTASFGGGVMVLGVTNATTNPSTNPTGGGILYADAGAGKWRGSGGTVTTFGPAEPHCPKCGTDVGVSQSENDLFGEELIHCHACEIRTGNGVVVHVADFFERRKAA